MSDLFNDEEMVDHILTEEDFVHHKDELADSGLEVGDTVELSKEELPEWEYIARPAGETTTGQPVPAEPEQPVTAREEQVDEAGDVLPTWARTPETRATLAEAKQLIKKVEGKPVNRSEHSTQEWEQA